MMVVEEIVEAVILGADVIVGNKKNKEEDEKENIL